MCLAEKFWRANSNFSHMFAVCCTKAHGKTCVCRVFDFWHTANARVCHVPNFHRVFPRWLTSKKQGCRVPGVCRAFWRVTHGKKFVCRVPFLCRVLLWSAHGKHYVCRVPEVQPTANLQAHGKRTVSGSGRYNFMQPTSYDALVPLQSVKIALTVCYQSIGNVSSHAVVQQAH